MECRKKVLIDRYGESFYKVITGEWLPCPVCKCTHSPNEDIPFEEEKQNEEMVKA